MIDEFIIYIYIYKLEVQENLYKQRIKRIISREGESNYKK